MSIVMSVSDKIAITVGVRWVLPAIKSANSWSWCAFHNICYHHRGRHAKIFGWANSLHPSLLLTLPFLPVAFFSLDTSPFSPSSVWSFPLALHSEIYTASLGFLAIVRLLLIHFVHTSDFSREYLWNDTRYPKSECELMENDSSRVLWKKSGELWYTNYWDLDVS